MSGGRKKKQKGHGGGHDGPDERWMASYMDMVTVLMCLFIVLYAMSSVNTSKYEALRDSLGEGFGNHKSEELTAVEGIVVPKEILEGDEDPEDVDHAIDEYKELDKIKSKIEKALEGTNLEGSATFTIDERGLVIGLTSSETFFAANSTILSSKATSLLRKIGPSLKSGGRDISVEGHADYRAPSGAYPTNWELSAARATGVLRYLVEHEGIKADHIKSVGFGSAQPIAKGTDAAALAKNRRVDIVVLSDENEDARNLIPDIAEANDH